MLNYLLNAAKKQFYELLNFMSFTADMDDLATELHPIAEYHVNYF